MTFCSAKKLMKCPLLSRLAAIPRKVVAASLCLMTSFAFGKKPMESLYDHREAASLRPYVYPIDSSIPVHLFPVPQDGAVGTNDLNNAITVLTFAKDRLIPKTHFRNAFKYVGGGGQYLPLPISDHSIGFAQARRFVIYDFKTNKA